MKANGCDTLSTADTDVQETWVENGVLKAIVSLAGGDTFLCVYDPNRAHAGVQFDIDEIGDFDPADVDSEVLGVMARDYNLDTLEEIG